VERDAKHTKAPVLPIVHLPKDSNGDYRVDLAPELVVEVSKELQPPLIAIPERELGRGVFDRTKAMVNIRQALHELFFYQPIHILGTGNPVTIALLTAAGADSFDGLEWCRYVADGRSRTLHHFQLYELFKWQDDYSSSEVMLAAAKDDNIRYTGKAILHNLDFYTSWVERLRVAARQPRRMIEFVTQLIPDEAMDLARASLPEVL